MAATGQPIPTIQITDSNGDVDMTVDEVLAQAEAFARTLEKHHTSMDTLCQQVRNVGIQQPGERQKEVYLFLILSNLNIGVDRFIYLGEEIRWVSFDAMTLDATNAVITKFLEQPSKKKVLIHCHDKFLESESMADIMEAVRCIRNKVATMPNNLVCFTSSVFPPALEKIWDKIEEYNLFIRNLNISMNTAPLSNHKAVLKKANTLKNLVSKGDCWLEKVNGTGLGSTLSQEGLKRLRKWFCVHLLTGMGYSNNAACTVNEGKPGPLQHTPGYKSPVMIAFLKQIGTYMPGSMPVRKDKYFKQRETSYKQDPLHPRLSTISRRSSTTSSSSGSGSSSRKSTFSGPRYGQSGRGTGRGAGSDAGRAQYDLKDQARLIQLEKDNSDLRNQVASLKADKRREEQDRRHREDQHIARVERLHNELEYLGYDRRNLQEKLLRAEQDYVYARDDAKEKYKDNKSRRE